jgi:2-polyprenyl-3-methyl-5-hydroxy-6-metoxy-1,4-benzoquinol methylase
VASPSAAFDAVARDYDRTFSHGQLGIWLRAAVHRHLAELVQPGDRVLELGCGTGEDALWLARQGVRVTATDASPAMLDVAARKASAAGLSDRIEFAQLDASTIGGRAPALYDGVLANFGVLNCLPDRRALAAGLAGWVWPGGWAALVVMSPLCPWEIGWYGLHGQFGRALRRLRAGARAHVGAGVYLPVWYPSPRRLAREMAPHFRPRRLVGIGAFLPPSYLSHLVERWPRLFARLAAAETRLAGRFPWTWLNDHYLMVLERQGGGVN